MALRPEIALQTQGIKLPDFAGAYESVLNNRARREGLDQNRQLHNAQMQEYQRKTAAAQAQAERDSATRAKLAGGATAKDIMGDDPELAMKLAGEERSAAEAEMKARLSGLDEEKKTLDIQLEKAKRFGSLAGSVNNAETLAINIGQAMREGLPDEIGIKLLKQGWTPETQAALKAFQEQALTADQQLTQRRQQIELEMKQAAEKREAEKQPLVVADLRNKVATGTPDPVTNLTAAQMAEQARAKAQQDFQAAENAKNRSVTMRGQNMTDARTREMAEITRDQKPLNEYETRNYGFFRRSADAESILSNMEPAIQDKNVFQKLYQKGAPNLIQTEENQSYEQAKRQFLAAYLRRDSGAVITPSEIEEGDKTFFSQPGDSKNVIEQKRKARQTVLKALEVGAGRAVQRVEGGSAEGGKARPKIEILSIK